MEITQTNQPAVMKRLLEKLLYVALKQVQNAPKSSCGSHVGVLNNGNSAVYLTVPGIVESLLKSGAAEFRVALEANVSIPSTDISQVPLKVVVDYTLEEIINDWHDEKALQAAKKALADSFSQKVLDSMYVRNVQLLIV